MWEFVINCKGDDLYFESKMLSSVLHLIRASRISYMSTKISPEIGPCSGEFQSTALPVLFRMKYIIIYEVQYNHLFLKTNNDLSLCDYRLSLHSCWFIDHIPLQWRHNECDGISDHQPHDCLLKCLFRCRSKKTSKLCTTGLCEGNSLVSGEFTAQRASNTENVSIWWHHHEHVYAWYPCI